MAEQEPNCPHFDTCGWIKWRKDAPFSSVRPLEGNVCEKVVKNILCGRVDEEIPQLPLEHYGPLTHEELDIGLLNVRTDSRGKERKLDKSDHQ